MDKKVLQFLMEKCDWMPEGTVPIYEMRLTGELVNWDGFDSELVEQVEVCLGPENYVTYKEDCYAVYLRYCAWPGIAESTPLPPLEFTMEVLKHPKIKLITNPRYPGKPPEFPNDLVGMCFVGIYCRG